VKVEARALARTRKCEEIAVDPHILITANLSNQWLQKRVRFGRGRRARRLSLGCHMTQQLKCVFVANGGLHAQQVRAFLEAAGIPTVERGESLRNTHGLTLDGLGAVEILVAESDVGRARSLLDSAEAGVFRLADDAETSSSDGTVTPPGLE